MSIAEFPEDRITAAHDLRGDLRSVHGVKMDALDVVGHQIHNLVDGIGDTGIPQRLTSDTAEYGIGRSENIFEGGSVFEIDP